MSEAATDTSCFGDTSMNCTSSRCTNLDSPITRAVTRSSTMRPSSSTMTLAWAMMPLSSSQAVR